MAAATTTSCLALALGLLLVASGAGAQQPRAGGRAASQGAPLQVHVRGAAELHAVATVSQGEMTIRGELMDDAGAPIPGARLAVSATAEGARGAIRVGPLHPCEDLGGRPDARGADDGLDTDERGAFCAVGAAPSAPGARVSVALRFRGSPLLDAAEILVPLEAVEEHLVHTAVRFEPAPETIDLDRDTVTVTASLRLERGEAARPTPSAQRGSLPLTLTDERGARVADAVTGGDGRAHFEVKTTALAGPGAGELTVRFAGNATLEKAEWSQPVVRRAEARVTLVKKPERADPEDGVALDVAIATGRGPVIGGIVEVKHLAASGGKEASESVGAATVDADGHAAIVAVFSAGGALRAPLSVRYVAAAPWYRAGPELRVEVALAGPGVGRSLLLGALVIAAAAWVLVGWRRAPPAPVAAGLERTKAPPSGRAGVHVLASPPDLAGWRGTVSDAHDASPIAGASLSVVAPSFQGDGVVARVVTDDHGAFTLEAAYRSDARLVVESPEHAAHEQALPPPSVLGVALVTRRRALLERLVRWARQRGAPFDGVPEPTPGHVRRAASRGGAADVEAWATRVEQAAYGADRVDAAVDRDVRSTEPRAPR